MSKMVSNHMFMLEVIEEREGYEMALAHETEKTMNEVINYFDNNYTVYNTNEVSEYEMIADIIKKLDNEKISLSDLIIENESTDLLEIMTLEGFLTNIRERYVFSTTHKWLEDK